MQQARGLGVFILATMVIFVAVTVLISVIWMGGGLQSSEPENLGRITDFELSAGFLSSNCKIYTTRGVYAGQGHECRDLQVNATLWENRFNELEVDAGGR